MRNWGVASVALAFLLAPGGALAAQICTSVKVPVGQMEVELPLRGELDTSDPAKPFPFTLTLDIEPVTSTIDAIVRSSGLDQNLGDKHLAYNGTLADVGGDQLHVKPHFRYRRGILIDTRGSVDAYFRVATDGRRLSLATAAIDLNISNDAVRELVKAAHIDRRIEEALSDRINGFLGSPEAQLQMPEALRGADIRISAASFASVDGRPVVTISGTAPASPVLFAAVLTTLGNC